MYTCVQLQKEQTFDIGACRFIIVHDRWRHLNDTAAVLPPRSSPREFSTAGGWLSHKISHYSEHFCRARVAAVLRHGETAVDLVNVAVVSRKSLGNTISRVYRDREP